MTGQRLPRARRRATCASVARVARFPRRARSSSSRGHSRREPRLGAWLRPIHWLAHALKHRAWAGDGQAGSPGPPRVPGRGEEVRRLRAPRRSLSLARSLSFRLGPGQRPCAPSRPLRHPPSMPRNTSSLVLPSPHPHRERVNSKQALPPPPRNALRRPHSGFGLHPPRGPRRRGGAAAAAAATAGRPAAAAPARLSAALPAAPVPSTRRSVAAAAAAVPAGGGSPTTGSTPVPQNTLLVIGGDGHPRPPGRAPRPGRRVRGPLHRAPPPEPGRLPARLGRDDRAGA